MTAFTEVFFDLDGTLADSSQGIKDSFAFTFKKMGKDVPSDAVLESFIGPPLEVSLGSLLDKHQLDQAISLYREYYRKNGIYGVRLYDSIPELLHQLKNSGRRLYITTSKNEAAAIQMLDNLGISSYFKAVFGALPHSYHKADVLRRALAAKDILPQQSVLIGDTAFDMLGAQKVGITPLGVLWGFGSREDLINSGAKMIAANPQEIVNLL